MNLGERSTFFFFLTHNNKSLFVYISIRTGGAQRITKTALGGFISFLFVSSLLSFTSYAITTYVKDNEDVTKAPITLNVLKTYQELAYFDFKVSMALQGRFEAESPLSAVIIGAEQRGSVVVPAAKVS